MVIGYYDMHGFPDLYAGVSSIQTESVSQAIASQGSGNQDSGLQLHYEDYALPMDSGSPVILPDRSQTNPPGAHFNDSVADYMHTSWSLDGNYYGWSWSNRIAASFLSYVQSKNSRYVETCSQYNMGSSLTWSVLTEEIDNHRPMVFLVDSDGDSYTDHFVAVVGYSDGPPLQYACLDTWYPYDQIRWCQFQPMSSGYSWGVWGGWSFRVQYSLVVGSLDGVVARSPSSTGYDSGSTVSLTATPNAGFHFAGWFGDAPQDHLYDNPLILTMDANKSLAADFQANTYKLTVDSSVAEGVDISSQTGFGGKTPFSHLGVPWGTSISLSVPATDPEGFAFSRWTLDGENQPDGLRSTDFTMTADCAAVAGYTAAARPLVWIDFGRQGEELGTQSQPFHSIARGYGAAIDGGTLRVLPGTSAEILRLTRAMRIEAFGGTAVIGLQSGGHAARFQSGIAAGGDYSAAQRTAASIDWMLYP